MKTVFAVAILTVLASLPLVAQTQDKQHDMDHSKHMRMMQMMKDSSMMDMMMSHIAADRQLRMRIMEKMAGYTEGDEASMKELCAVMMKGKDENSSEHGTGCGMMKHEKMPAKTGEQEERKQEKEDQGKAHKH